MATVGSLSYFTVLVFKAGAKFTLCTCCTCVMCVCVPACVYASAFVCVCTRARVCVCGGGGGLKLHNTNDGLTYLKKADSVCHLFEHLL